MSLSTNSRLFRCTLYCLWTLAAFGIGLAGHQLPWIGEAQSAPAARKSQPATATKAARAAARLRNLPHVEKYGKTTPFDLEDPQGRMKRSVWNYFFLDQKNKILAGYWEAEDGAERLGTDPFYELLLVLEGRLYVEAKGKTHVAEPGDTVIVVPGRPCKVMVKEPVKSFFICCPVDDPLGYEDRILELMEKRGP